MWGIGIEWGGAYYGLEMIGDGHECGGGRRVLTMDFYLLPNYGLAGDGRKHCVGGGGYGVRMVWLVCM
jgi:hypothetical protein